MTDPLARFRASLAHRYTLQRELGRGGMATVYLARDLKHDRPVALKVLKPELAATLGPDRFLREIKLAAQLQHPHIVPLHDSGASEGFLYYVMPYVEGESLRDRLDREKQLPLEDALQITKEVAAGLTQAHTHGVVHRDIKPENILLSGGVAVVADFGIARAVAEAGGEHLTETGLAIGTPPYMSPEQGAGSKELDGRTDLYSLACVLYEMLLGHPPFSGATPQAILARHSLEAPPSLRVARPTVPEAVERAVRRALAKVPADRFTTAAQFAQALTHAEPRRAWVWRLAVGVGAVAGLVAAGLWVPESPLARLRASRIAADTTPRPWTIIADFEGSADSSLRRTVRDVVRDALDESTIIRALSAQDVTRGLQLAGKSPETALDVEVARELAERHAIRTVVVGQLDRVGESYALAVRVLDRERGAVIAVAREAADGDDEIIPAVGRMIRQLRRALGERRGEIEAEEWRLPAGTRSLDAFRRVQEGRELVQIHGNNWQSVALYREALALDSRFIHAWTNLGMQFFLLGFRDSALTTLESARRRLGQESEEERLALEFADAWGRGEAQRQLWAAERLVQMDSDSPRNHFLRGLALLVLGRYEESIDAFERAEALEPVAAYPQDFFNRVQALVMLGRYDEAWAVAQRATGTWGPAARLQVAGVRDDWGFADSIATAFERGPGAPNATRLRASVLATRGAASAAARALGQLANTQASKRRLTLLALYSGMPVGPPDSVIAVEKSGRGIVTHSFWAAAAGDTVAALRRITELEVRLGDQVVEYGAWRQFVRSLVAAQGGRWKEVIELLAATAIEPRAEDSSFIRDIVGAVPLRWLVARAYEQLGQLDSAVAYYELVISPRVWGVGQALGRGLAYSFAYQRLVVLYARMGRLEDARRHYKIFTETFTDPDPNLVYLLADAREALLAAERRGG